MSPTYDTTDFSVTVTLCALGFRLLEVEKADYRRSIFRFQFDEQIPVCVEAFFRDELSINPRLILLNSKLVKDRLYGN